MNSRERFRESLLFGKPDRVTLTSHFGPKQSLVEKWREQGLPPDDSYVRIHGIERADRLPINFNPLPAYKQEVLGEFGGHILVRNHLGQVVEHEKDPKLVDYQTRAWHDFPVKAREDFEEMKWRYNPESPGRYPDFWDETARSLRDRSYPVSLTFPSMFWRIRDWTGLARLCKMLYREPDLVREMFQFWTEFVIETSRRALTTLDVDYVLMSDDMAYKGRAMIGPEMMREFMLPLYRRWVKHFREHGVDVILMDSDGLVHEIAPVWVEAGINVLVPMEVNAGNDMLALREELGHSMAFMGGIDKMKLAIGGRALEKEFESKAPQLIEDGGYIPCCDHYLPPNISYANYCQFISLLKKYCGWES
jgi:uroporphyrinogen decarboxylase